MKDALSVADLEVACAADGYEALALVMKSRPALILCDLKMPGLDGFSLMSRLRELDGIADTPVIILSGTRDAWTGVPAG